MSKNFKSRIQHKHDIEANWNNAKNFIPLQGELIIYDMHDEDGNQVYPRTRYKIGDGINAVKDLPFINEDVLRVTDRGVAGGIAELSPLGKVPTSQLPSYVDDVVEGRLYDEDFFAVPSYMDSFNYNFTYTPSINKIALHNLDKNNYISAEISGVTNQFGYEVDNETGSISLTNGRSATILTRDSDDWFERSVHTLFATANNGYVTISAVQEVMGEYPDEDIPQDPDGNVPDDDDNVYLRIESGKAYISIDTNILLDYALEGIVPITVLEEGTGNPVNVYLDFTEDEDIQDIVPVLIVDDVKYTAWANNPSLITDFSITSDTPDTPITLYYTKIAGNIHIPIHSLTYDDIIASDIVFVNRANPMESVEQVSRSYDDGIILIIDGVTYQERSLSDYGQYANAIYLEPDRFEISKLISGPTVWPFMIPAGNYRFTISIHPENVESDELFSNLQLIDGYYPYREDNYEFNRFCPILQIENKFNGEESYTIYHTCPTSGKIYLDSITNKCYRLGGYSFVEIAQSLALGTTHETAYRGDRGKIAYDHSQLTSNNPHKVSKTDIGLSNVENKSSDTIRSEITSENVHSALKGSGDNSIVLNNGLATGKYSLAGGTADKSLINDIVGEVIGNQIPDISSAEAAAVMSIAYGAGSTAHSSGSNAFGVQNQSGFLGYYIHWISEDKKTITLSTSQVRNRVNPNPSILDLWKPGYVVFIINDSTYTACGEIDSVDAANGTITVKEELPFGSAFRPVKSINYGLGTYDIDIPEAPHDRSIIALPPISEVEYKHTLDLGFLGKPSISTGEYFDTFRAKAVGEVELGFSSTTFGFDNAALGSISTVFGMHNVAHGTASFVTGRENLGGWGALVGGYKNKVTGDTSFAAGRLNTSTGNNSATFGSSNTASGKNSAAFGTSGLAQGDNSFTSGNGPQAYGANSTAFGTRGIAYGDHSFIEGLSMCFHDINKILTNKLVEGERTEAQRVNDYWSSFDNVNDKFSMAYGSYSHVEGRDNLALAYGTHAEGLRTRAIGKVSHSEGQNTQAIGDASHAGGINTIAEGNYSTAIGNSTHAKDNSQFVTGKYNEQADGAFIIGNGTSSNRKNIFTVDWNGNIKATGNISNEDAEAETRSLMTLSTGGAIFTTTWYDDFSRETAVQKDTTTVNQSTISIESHNDINVPENVLSKITIRPEKIEFYKKETKHDENDTELITETSTVSLTATDVSDIKSVASLPIAKKYAVNAFVDQILDTSMTINSGKLAGTKNNWIAFGNKYNLIPLARPVGTYNRRGVDINITNTGKIVLNGTYTKAASDAYGATSWNLAYPSSSVDANGDCAVYLPAGTYIVSGIQLQYKDLVTNGTSYAYGYGQSSTETLIAAPSGSGDVKDKLTEQGTYYVTFENPVCVVRFSLYLTNGTSYNNAEFVPYLYKLPSGYSMNELPLQVINGVPTIAGTSVNTANEFYGKLVRVSSTLAAETSYQLTSSQINPKVYISVYNSDNNAPLSTGYGYSNKTIKDKDALMSRHTNMYSGTDSPSDVFGCDGDIYIMY